MGSILSIISAISALAGMFKEVMSIIRQVQLLFRKSPVEEQAKDEKKHSDSQKKTENEDDTSGAFGG